MRALTRDFCCLPAIRTETAETPKGGLARVNSRFLVQLRDIPTVGNLQRGGNIVYVL